MEALVGLEHYRLVRLVAFVVSLGLGSVGPFGALHLDGALHCGNNAAANRDGTSDDDRQWYSLESHRRTLLCCHDEMDHIARPV